MRTKTCKICKTQMIKVMLDSGKIIWQCPNCGASAPLRKPGPAPDVALRLGEERRAWLEAHGGASAWIKNAIDVAIIEERQWTICAEIATKWAKSD